MPKRTSNEEKRQTAEAINIIESLMGTNNVKDNKILLDILRREVSPLNKKLVQLVLQSDGGSKKK